MENNELSVETTKYLKEADLKHRKALGQYFTPRTLREELLRRLPKIKNAKILDPASGSGEFLKTAKEYFPDGKIYGWEIDPKLAKISKKLAPFANIECVNSLSKTENEKFDFIIGNPPYFQFKLSDEERNEYKEIISGRVNIFGLFIYKSIKLLKEGGYMAFVIPPSMNNGAYFAKLREFIVNNCNIEFLSIQKTALLFDDAMQGVMLLILKKGKNNGNYVFKKNGVLIFSEEITHLEKIFKNSATLSDFGYRVQTGRVVWNQNKHLLTHNSNGAIQLIWSHNITENGLELNNKPNKPQFVKISSYEEGPVIVTNRIVGQPGKGSLRAAIVPANVRFVAENHVNVIYPPREQKLLGGMPKIKMSEIVKQLNSPANIQILCGLTGNTQISKTELEKLFPIGLNFV